MSTTIEQEIQLGNTINELHRIFDLINEKSFANKLEKPLIVVQSNKRRTLGTFSVNRLWEHKKANQDKGKFEITLSAEHLNRPIEEICGTLIHEMVHLHCELSDIKDTSNNHVYHNKNFKKEAESHGLIIEKAPTIGWSVTTLQGPTKELLKTFKIDESLFEYYRNSPKPLVKIKLSDLNKEDKIQRLKDKRAALENQLDKVQQRIEQLESNE